jgi:hypothetical protein
MLDTVDAVLGEIEAKREREQLISDTPVGALGYLRSVYSDPMQPTSVRMKAAIEALPYETPKLAVSAFVSGTDIAALLEHRTKLIAEGRVGVQVVGEDGQRRAVRQG